MRTILAVLWALVLTGLCGCGGGSSNTGGTTPQKPTPPTLNGNWEIQADSEVSANTTYLMGGNLDTAGTKVSGILHFLNFSCFLQSVPSGTEIDDIPVTGTVSSAGALSLTSSAVQQQTVKLTGTMSGGEIASGTYSVSGGCGNGEHGTITGFAVPSFTGTYSGTFASASGLVIDTTDTLTQSTTPSSDGSYTVSGSSTYTGSPCFTSGSIATSLVVGGFVQVQITTGNGLVLFTGTITDSTGNTITGNYSITGGSPGCAGDSGTGSVTRE